MTAWITACVGFAFGCFFAIFLMTGTIHKAERQVYELSKQLIACESRTASP